MGCDCGEKLNGVGDALDRLNRVLATRLLHAQQAPLEQFVTRVPRQSVVTVGAAATTAVDSSLTPVEGHAWYVERISKHCSSGTAVLEVLVGPRGVTDSAYRRDISPASTDDIADELNPIYVPPGDFLVASWSSATAGAVLTAAFQIRVVKVGRPQSVSFGS